MVVQENHYYPFGLGMKGLDYVAPSPNVENKFTFNGQTEKEISLGLNWFETVYRSYDPQLGRFTQIDPLADYFTSNTTYDYAFGNPIMFNDPFGLSPNGELPSLVKRMWLNLRLSIKKAAHSLGLAKNNYIKYSSKDNFADRHMGYFMPVFGGSKDKPTNTDSQTNDSQIVDNNNTSKAGEINSNDNDIKLIQSTPNISFPAPETTLPNIQPYKPNVPSTQGVALADRWLNGPITQKAAPPQIISGMNILREIANYLIIANGMRLTTNNVIIITGLTTSFNNNRTLNFRDGTFYDRNTLGRIMNARLAFVQQTLSNMGVQNWQIRISNALFIQYNSPPDALNRSQIQMRFIRQ
jgi:RHS repeat-associated protein